MQLEFPQELPFAWCQPQPKRPRDFHQILIEVPGFNNSTTVVPSGRVVTCVVLNEDIITNLQ